MRKSFYDRLPDMECLAGDTLPSFEIEVESDTAVNLSECTMQIIVSRSDEPNIAAICKECTPNATGFSVTLTSSDTIKLMEHKYDVHFRLVDTEGNSYRKLFGTLYVHSVPGGDPVI